jgi:hypothetical protein
MRVTPQLKLRFDPLDPRGIYGFIALGVLWILWGLLPPPESHLLRMAARLAGYAALAGMLVPYIHILQRSLRSRPSRRMSSWLRWHIAASFVAFFFLLIHSNGRASSPLTLALLGLTWIVMLSGVAGFYGQKLLYSILPEMKQVPHEFGMERMEPEREAIYEAASKELKKKEMVGAQAVVNDFARSAVESYLRQPFRIWNSHRRAYGPESSKFEERAYTHALLLAPDGQRGIVEEIWKLVEARKRLDYEYRLHQWGRLWLLFHGPASWALLVLIIEHVWLSVRYGGF